MVPLLCLALDFYVGGPLANQVFWEFHWEGEELVWGGEGGERMGGNYSLDCVGGVCVMNTETFRSNPLFSGLS